MFREYQELIVLQSISDAFLTGLRRSHRNPNEISDKNSQYPHRNPFKEFDVVPLGFPWTISWIPIEIPTGENHSHSHSNDNQGD